MEKICFSLVKCNAIDDLLYVTEVTDYKTIKHANYSEYVVFLKDFNAYRLYYCVKDLDIYIDDSNVYLSDYILLKKSPTKTIVDLLNKFTIDDLFAHVLSQQKVLQSTKQIQKQFRKNQTHK